MGKIHRYQPNPAGPDSGTLSARMPESKPTDTCVAVTLRPLSDTKAPAVWPRLFATARIAAAPSRVMLGTLLVVLLGLVSKLPSLWLSTESKDPVTVLGARFGATLAKLQAAVFELKPGPAVGQLVELIVGPVTGAFRAAPWSSLAVAVPALMLFGVIGGAIARSAAVSFVGRGTMSGVEALAFALRRGRGFALVLLAPWMVVGLLWVLTAALGWAGLSLAYVQVVGAVLSGLALVTGTIMFGLIAAFAVGGAMLPGALACEGTDAIDAVQRVVAYSWARPARLVASFVTLLLVMMAVGAAAGAAAAAIKMIAASTLTVWMPNDEAQYLRFWLLRGEAPFTQTIEATGSLRATGRVLAFWGKVPGLLVSGYVLSFVFSGGSVWYLLSRLVCDGQEPEELWSPSAPVSRPDDGGSADGVDE